jgi:DNA-binding transcriptional regulator YiaG
MIDRRKVKGTILQRKDYDYARHNELRVMPYEYAPTLPILETPRDIQIIETGNKPKWREVNKLINIDSGIAARPLGASGDYAIVQHGNAPLPQNTWNGQRIRGLRKRLRLSARKFGHMLGFPGKNCHITIYRHETDKIKPSIQTVMILEQLEKDNKLS